MSRFAAGASLGGDAKTGRARATSTRRCVSVIETHRGAMALAAHKARAGGDTDPAHAGRIATARFFAENVAVGADGLEATITGAAESVLTADLALAV